MFLFQQYLSMAFNRSAAFFLKTATAAVVAA